uniref:Uncharacterized protein n=1 Tax=Noctiluca scintillans TaxID=2966 RepID=A0A7S1EZW2_NOCSC|mmetsp:Transcript_21135/g.56325  ORF Transcript_21135/g.56325 Transcript_21135/m.56325 type:complete len:1214 (+) Transcript_21135:82-3723(+)
MRAWGFEPPREVTKEDGLWDDRAKVNLKEASTVPKDTSPHKSPQKGSPAVRLEARRVRAHSRDLCHDETREHGNVAPGGAPARSHSPAKEAPRGARPKLRPRSALTGREGQLKGARNELPKQEEGQSKAKPPQRWDLEAHRGPARRARGFSVKPLRGVSRVHRQSDEKRRRRAPKSDTSTSAAKKTQVSNLDGVLKASDLTMDDSRFPNSFQEPVVSCSNELVGGEALCARPKLAPRGPRRDPQSAQEVIAGTVRCRSMSGREDAGRERRTRKRKWSKETGKRRKSTRQRREKDTSPQSGVSLASGHKLSRRDEEKNCGESHGDQAKLVSARLGVQRELGEPAYVESEDLLERDAKQQQPQQQQPEESQAEEHVKAEQSDATEEGSESHPDVATEPKSEHGLTSKSKSGSQERQDSRIRSASATRGDGATRDTNLNSEFEQATRKLVEEQAPLRLDELDQLDNADDLHFQARSCQRYKTSPNRVVGNASAVEKSSLRKGSRDIKKDHKYERARQKKSSKKRKHSSSDSQSSALKSRRRHRLTRGAMAPMGAMVPMGPMGPMGPMMGPMGPGSMALPLGYSERKRRQKSREKRVHKTLQGCEALTSAVLAAARSPDAVNRIRGLILDVYRRRNPAKLCELDTLLAKYSGSEVEVYAHICKKYGEAPDLASLVDFDRPESAIGKGCARKASAPAPMKATRDREHAGWPFEEDYSDNSEGSGRTYKPCDRPVSALFLDQQFPLRSVEAAAHGQIASAAKAARERALKETEDQRRFAALLERRTPASQARPLGWSLVRTAPRSDSNDSAPCAETIPSAAEEHLNDSVTPGPHECASNEQASASRSVSPGPSQPPDGSATEGSASPEPSPCSPALRERPAVQRHVESVDTSTTVKLEQAPNLDAETLEETPPEKMDVQPPCEEDALKEPFLPVKIEPPRKSPPSKVPPQKAPPTTRLTDCHELGPAKTAAWHGAPETVDPTDMPPELLCSAAEVKLEPPVPKPHLGESKALPPRSPVTLRDPPAVPSDQTRQAEELQQCLNLYRTPQTSLAWIPQWPSASLQMGQTWLPVPPPPGPPPPCPPPLAPPPIGPPLVGAPPAPPAGAPPAGPQSAGPPLAGAPQANVPGGSLCGFGQSPVPPPHPQMSMPPLQVWDPALQQWPMAGPWLLAGTPLLSQLGGTYGSLAGYPSGAFSSALPLAGGQAAIPSELPHAHGLLQTS